jgi:hypothetical protein
VTIQAGISSAFACPWTGRFAEDVEALDERAKIIIPSLDDQLVWDSCRWQSRDNMTLPNRGDWCLALFDEDQQPHVVAWWPFST